jgi:hypothetical protein
MMDVRCWMMIDARYRMQDGRCLMKDEIEVGVGPSQWVNSKSIIIKNSGSTGKPVRDAKKCRRPL